MPQPHRTVPRKADRKKSRLSSRLFPPSWERDSVRERLTTCSHDKSGAHCSTVSSHIRGAATTTTTTDRRRQFKRALRNRARLFNPWNASRCQLAALADHSLAAYTFAGMNAMKIASKLYTSSGINDIVDLSHARAQRFIMHLRDWRR